MGNYFLKISSRSQHGGFDCSEELAWRMLVLIMGKKSINTNNSKTKTKTPVTSISQGF
jgi:hypothetical protein